MQNFHLKQSISLIVLALLMSVQSFAQDQNLKWAPFKLSPAPLPSALQFGYERTLGEQTTIGGTIKLFIPRSLENTDVTFESNDITTATGNFTSGRFNGYVITPELRYYTSKRAGAGNGFYLMPFLRYYNYSTDGDFLYQPTNGEENSTIDAKINFSGFGGGFSIGVQKIWDSGFLIDWNAGLGLAIAGGRLRGTVEGPVQDDIPQFIDDLSDAISTLPLVNAQLSNDGNSLDARGTGLPWPIVKSHIAIGYAF